MKQVSPSGAKLVELVLVHVSERVCLGWGKRRSGTAEPATRRPSNIRTVKQGGDGRRGFGSGSGGRDGRTVRG